MKFMVIMKATPDSEAGKLPAPAVIEGMAKFNDELIKAGILLDGAGLHPSRRGARISYSTSGKVSVVDGPFAETKDLIAGFWILQCKSLEEVKAWLLKLPGYLPPEGKTEDSTIEVRQILDPGDFGPEVEARVNAQIASNPNARK